MPSDNPKLALAGDTQNLETHRCSVLDCNQIRTVQLTTSKQEAPLDSNTLAHTIVAIVEEKQATDIVLLDVHEQTSIADYFVIATIDNERQARAVEDEMLQSLKVKQNIRPLSIEGVGEDAVGGWAVLDYGDVLVHLFTEEMRKFYNLEGLWNKANVVVKVL